MTDKTDTPTMSAEEAAGRALVARKTFEKEAVWLPMLAVQHWNAGEMVVDGKTFTDCLIEGPAVMAVMTGTQFDSCHMGVAENPRTLLLKPVGEKIAGVVGMSNCRFVRCRFAQVGFTGTSEMLEGMERDLLSARKESAAEGARA
ncbi:hypothetical protein [Brevundimonas sp.]|jgi:hypothetical protein|uniref:hypothetical protein n=1 Tax=Brevundimonas sp. TaxID=1871086 RepID=UPI001D337541|nr:hypothetical protein [Brevundimonas sp.]MBA4001100.1 hypothetical protein [Brevundimonas sp.]